MTNAPIDLRDVAVNADRMLSVLAGWATADPGTADAFAAWLDQYEITPAQLDRELERHGTIALDLLLSIAEWTGPRGYDLDHELVYWPAEDWHGSITWARLPNGDVLGQDDGGYQWHIPAGAGPMPYVTGFR